MFSHIMKLVLVTTLTVLVFSANSNAQILLVDDERVEREAAAYKDFNLQTAELRQNILQLRQFITRGGVVEQQLADLEQRKAIIGDTKYNEEKAKLESQYVQAQQALSQLEYNFDALRQEAMVQVERARQPVIRNLLSSRGAQVVMLKRLVLGAAPGIDITTEFIELLNADLPTVTLASLQKTDTSN